MEKKWITWISLSLCAGMALSMSLSALSRARAEKENTAAKISENPLYEKFVEIGRAHGLDMGFTKKASCQSGMLLELEKHPLLRGEPKSCDILFVGDSSTAWGLVPEVVEQMTGRQVGVFAYEALTLNEAAARVVANMASYYLRDGGLLVLGFGGWTQELPADSVILIHTQWLTSVSQMDAKAFARYMAGWKKEVEENASGKKVSLGKELLYSRHTANKARLQATLSGLGMSLFQIELYGQYVEPVLNPGWHKKKLEMKSKLICQIRWNPRSVMNYTNEADARSIRSLAEGDPAYRNRNVERVSAIIEKIPAHKAYLISLNCKDDNYAKMRSIYGAYYSKFCGLIDLGKEHPEKDSYPMDAKEHMVNEGVVNLSVLVGRSLARDYAKFTKGR